MDFSVPSLHISCSHLNSAFLFQNKLPDDPEYAEIQYYKISLNLYPYFIYAGSEGPDKTAHMGKHTRFQQLLHMHKCL